MKYILCIALFWLGFCFPQQVLLETNGCCMDSVDFTCFLDSLRFYGATVNMTIITGYANIHDMDMYWGTLGGYYTHDYEYESIIVDYARSQGRIVIWAPSSHPDSGLYCLLSNSTWSPTLEILDTFVNRDVNRDRFFSFQRLDEGIDYIRFYSPLTISCGDHAYPFVFSDSFPNRWYTDPIAAIAYPFLHEGNCESYIMLGTGVHYWQDEAGPYPGSDGWRLATNMLLTGAGISGWELPPCAIPEPYCIDVDSCPNCASPGDTVTLYGNNLWQGNNENIGGDIEIYIGDTVIIPIEYSHYEPVCSTLYNTWLEFICPDLPIGTYQIELGHKAILFDGGEIQIPCDYDYCSRFPNPFTPNSDDINDFTQFEFDNMGNSEGTIYIYNIHGHEVRQIDVPAGANAKTAAQWHGADNNGNPLPQGLYIYVIESGGEIVCEGTVTLAR